MKRLEKAVRELTRYYGDDIYDAWTVAYEKLHVRGFHEGDLTVEDVKGLALRIERLIAILQGEIMRLEQGRISQVGVLSLKPGVCMRR